MAASDRPALSPSFRCLSPFLAGLYLAAASLLMVLPAIGVYKTLFDPPVPAIDWSSAQGVFLMAFLSALLLFGGFLVAVVILAGRLRRFAADEVGVRLRMGRRERWIARWDSVELIRTSSNRGLEFRREGMWHSVGSRFGDRTPSSLPESALRAVFLQAARRAIPVDDGAGISYSFGLVYGPPRGSSLAAVNAASAVWNPAPKEVRRRAAGWVLVGMTGVIVASSLVPAFFGQPVWGIGIVLILILSVRALAVVNLGGASM